jgi:dihydrofolate synthase/folylpolyglutamate synthase
VTSPRLAAVSARLDALVDWERRQRAAMRVSTDPARALLERLGSPERGLRVVHVTGSKGKGSTSSLVAAGLRAAGLRVGRYASPHVERLNERVVIDGREIEDDLLAEGLERALAAREQVVAADPRIDPTWFDVVTAAALWCFREARVEWLVAEVGLGGRLDSTNVLHGEVCVITNVELEHTQVLGDTRAKIASEKAGILKRGSTLVTSLAESDEAGAVVAARARELGCTVRRPSWAGGAPPTSIARANRDLAELVLDELGRRGVLTAEELPVAAALLSDESAAAARLPARCERFTVGGRTVVLDGAHTPGSVAALLRELENDPRLAAAPLVAVVGLARDKDLSAILKTVAARAERVLCTSVGSALHRTAEELGAALEASGARYEVLVPPRAAVDRAVELATAGWVLVVGSLHLAGAVRPHLKQLHKPA